jgi:hypothetical protein
MIEQEFQAQNAAIKTITTILQTELVSLDLRALKVHFELAQ